MSERKKAGSDQCSPGCLFPGKANIMVTGGTGFIGSNFITYVLGRPDFAGRIVNYDKLTYAGNRLNLLDISDLDGGKQYCFEHGYICDWENVKKLLIKYEVGIIVHFADESHVDDYPKRTDTNYSKRKY